MSKYATIDQNGVVTGFYSSDLFPPPSGAIPISDSVWQLWLANTHSQAWVNGELVPYTPPTPVLTISQQAANALAAGLNITSASTSALNGTYAVDSTAQQRLSAVQTRINAGLGLPLGLSTIAWVDMVGVVHNLTAAEFTALAHAISDYVYQLEMLMMGHGNTMPSSSAAIT